MCTAQDKDPASAADHKDTALSEYNQIQITEALGDDNRNFYRLATGIDADLSTDAGKDALIMYYINNGGALGYAQRVQLRDSAAADELANEKNSESD
ncbi:MAG: hypothetical protein ACOYUK_03495 [Patescibacteria group bacterium]